MILIDSRPLISNLNVIYNLIMNESNLLAKFYRVVRKWNSKNYFTNFRTYKLSDFTLA